MQLRDYQEKLISDTFEAWRQGFRNVLLVSPTGSGKTHTKSALIMQSGYVALCIAHRQELVSQISESLAAFGIPHRILAPSAVVKYCVARHMRKFGKSFVDPNGAIAVAGVDTLRARADTLKHFLKMVQLWDIDEAHHVQPDNKWGAAVKLVPNARGLGVTATPERCDGKGLDGAFDTMVLGPSMRDLIERGYLTDYRVICPPQMIDMAQIRQSKASGEYVKKDVKDATSESKIVGDIVKQYKSFADGKRGLTFTVDVEEATKTAQAYNDAGVPAQVVSAKTPDSIRSALLDKLAAGQLLQLVNVDLFGEGMDCPALEVVSFARPTQSYGLFVQQFGRVLRPFEGKVKGIVIDHVGNFLRHGPPDAPREWSLAGTRGSRKVDPEDEPIPLTACTKCFKPYPRSKPACPFCGHKPVPEQRGGPEFVDGDLVELDPEVLAAMRRQVTNQDKPFPGKVTTPAEAAMRNNWNARIATQQVLRDCISEWAGIMKHGHSACDSEIMKTFYIRFGIDIVGAQGLGGSKADKLIDKIRGQMI